MSKIQDSQTDSLTVLYEIARDLAGADDLETLLKNALKSLRGFGMARGAIALHDPESDELNIEIAHNLSPSQMKRGRYKKGEGIVGTVFETGRPIAAPRVGSEPLFLDRTGARKNLDLSDVSFVCVPIKRRTKTIGALSVDKPFEDRANLDADVRFLTIVAALLSDALRSYQKRVLETRELEQENRRLRAELKGRFSFPNMIGNSHRMRESCQLAMQVAASDATVSLRGETGVGKELIASGIHYASRRADKPFVRVNCPAFPEGLVESELFGHVKGAFTGALKDKKGRFELADGGTIFLDEIGDLAFPVQAKLLRVLQEREFEPLGSERTMKVNVRVIVATNKNLEESVQKGDFREDLYYRMNGFAIFIPPLRERRGDLPALIDHFVEKYARANGKSVNRVSTPAIDLLMKYHWPGNVRELENAIERAVILCDGPALQAHHFSPTLQTMQSSMELSGPGRSPSLGELVERLERSTIEDALITTSGNKAAAARILGLTERILSYKMGKLGIHPQKPTKMQ